MYVYCAKSIGLVKKWRAKAIGLHNAFRMQLKGGRRVVILPGTANALHRDRLTCYLIKAMASIADSDRSTLSTLKSNGNTYNALSAVEKTLMRI